MAWVTGIACHHQIGLAAEAVIPEFAMQPGGLSRQVNIVDEALARVRRRRIRRRTVASSGIAELAHVAEPNEDRECA